jgi:Protein of unknown function (DUF3039)
MTATVTEFDNKTQLDSGPVAHIIKTEPGITATAAVLEARINGIPLTALCGVVFIPQKDPKNLPICAKCKEIYDLMRMFNENLNETPNT